MSEHIGFRCPDDIVDAIKRQMEATGKGRTEVLVEALRRGLGMPAEDDTEHLKAELDAVKQRLNVIEGKLTA